MSKFALICLAALLYTNTFEMETNYSHDQSRGHFQEFNRRACYTSRCYSTNKVNYNNSSRGHKRAKQIRKMLDKEREGTCTLFSNYDYDEALNFFSKVCDSERYPILTWNNYRVNMDRLKEVDLGKFDQRQQFVDMFEYYDGKGVNISMRINFSYGGLRHDMFIEQPEGSNQYNTDKFLFQSNVNFDETQATNERGYIKPYLSKKNKIGILSKFINHPDKIKNFATNVLRIMKLSPKNILPVNVSVMDINRVLAFEAFEIAGMILSSERLRSKKALLLSYIEFYKLKHTTTPQDSLSMLLDMFDKDEPILRFPASPGGLAYIQATSPYYIYKRFLNMIKYSPQYPIIKQCTDRKQQRKLMDEFFSRKLERIRAVLENRAPMFDTKNDSKASQTNSSDPRFSQYMSSTSSNDKYLASTSSNSVYCSQNMNSTTSDDEYDRCWDQLDEVIGSADGDSIINDVMFDELYKCEEFDCDRIVNDAINAYNNRQLKSELNSSDSTSSNLN